MRADESVFGVADGIVCFSEVANTDSKFEIYLVSCAFQAIESHVRDDGKSSSQLRLLADSCVEKPHADCWIIRFRLPRFSAESYLVDTQFEKRKVSTEHFHFWVVADDETIAGAKLDLKIFIYDSIVGFC